MQSNTGLDVDKAILEYSFVLYKCHRLCGQGLNFKQEVHLVVFIWPNHYSPRKHNQFVNEAVSDLLYVFSQCRVLVLTPN